MPTNDRDTPLHRSALRCPLTTQEDGKAQDLWAGHVHDVSTTEEAGPMNMNSTVKVRAQNITPGQNPLQQTV